MFDNVVKVIKKYDFSFILLALLIFFVGVFNLYSATHSMTSEVMRNLYKTQSFWFLLAMVICLFTSFVSSKVFFRMSYWIYAFNVFLLVVVLVMGIKGMGAQRWISLGPIRFQPSEIMKISLTLALARYFSDKATLDYLKLKDLIVPWVITLVPAILVILQPDLGTGLLLILIFLTMSFYRRLHYKSILKIVFLGLLGSLVMYQFGLKDYQKRRILTFIDPYADAKGSGYNAIQSQIAIGSGRVMGKGFMNSSQASLNFLPENHTDFVFSIFNEEHGFLGSIFLIALYLVLFMRYIWLSNVSLLFYDSLLSIGLMSVFFWHTFINMSMVMGLMPIVGLPLPLMSYGGSSLITFGLAIGLATSLSNSRNFF